uniref:Uncharacterized protein n=1 Tax=Brassica oleracea TaxID=3712 RepID=A0A3P6EPA8_BRAOL|nr:unnamed protein product [Brassica oleracea]
MTSETHPTAVLHSDRPKDNNIERYRHRSDISSSQFISSELHKSIALSHYTHMLTRCRRADSHNTKNKTGPPRTQY